MTEKRKRGKTGTKKRVRVKFLVLPGFQLRLIFTTASIMILFSLLAAGIVTYLTDRNYRSDLHSVRILTEKLKIEDTIVQSFITYAGSMSSKVYELRTDKIKRDHEESMVKLDATIRELRSSMEKSRRTVRILYAVMIVQIVVYLLYVSRLSNRIAAPIWIVMQSLKDAGTKRTFTERPIRKSDKFHELHSLVMRHLGNLYLKKPVRRNAARKKSDSPIPAESVQPAEDASRAFEEISRA